MKQLLRKIHGFSTATSAPILLMACLLVSCAGRKTLVYDSELQRLKAASQRKISSDIDEFNKYKDRSESDGPFNAGNNKAFLLQNVPLFISSDEVITKVYNYRWWMTSKHLKAYEDPDDRKKYWVVTEFFLELSPGHPLAEQLPVLQDINFMTCDGCATPNSYAHMPIILCVDQPPG